MKVGLISSSLDIWDNGLRMISSVIKNAGHDTKMVFMSKIVSKSYDDNILEKLYKIVSDCDLIGVSCASQYSCDVIQIIEFLRTRADTPIVWGGVHATLCPEQCILYADYVCVGDGELAIVDLINAISNRGDSSEVRNIWSRVDNVIKRNNNVLVINDLNSLPFYDYDIENHWTIYKNKIVKFAEKHFFNGITNFAVLTKPSDGRNLSNLFLVNFSRGCLFSCSYCCNHKIQIINNCKVVRREKISRMIENLLEIKNKFLSIGIFWFTDDDFFSMSIEDLKIFRDEYNRKINIPFMCYATPVSIEREKIDIALSFGLVKIEMGIQTGADNTKILYNRNISNKKIISSSKILSDFKDRMIIPDYQFIFSNPYENDVDILQTIDLIRKLHTPFYLQPFPLHFFHGTELRKKAIDDGIISELEEDEMINYFEYSKSLYNRRDQINIYLNYIIRLMQGRHTEFRCGRIPRLYLRLLTRDVVINFMTKHAYILEFVTGVSSKFLSRDSFNSKILALLTVLLSSDINKRNFIHLFFQRRWA